MADYTRYLVQSRNGATAATNAQSTNVDGTGKAVEDQTSPGYYLDLEVEYYWPTTGPSPGPTSAVNVVAWQGVTVPTPSVNGFPDVTCQNILNAAAIRAALGMAIANLDAQLATIDADVLTRSTLTQANIRTAVGLAAANLDTQLSQIDTHVLAGLTPSTGIPEAYSVVGSANPSLAQLLHEMNQRLSNITITGAQRTIQARDATTTVMTDTLDSATDPTKSERTA